MSIRPMVNKLTGYEAAHTRAAFFMRANPGFLIISGKDRLDFLQRQTTNDIMSLGPGEVKQTVLTSSTARVLDVFFVFVNDKERSGVITLPGKAEKTAGYLRKRIFFMDSVEVADHSREFVQVDIDGPDARELLMGLGVEVPSENGALIEAELAGVRLRVISKVGLSKIGYRILVHAESSDRLLDILSSAGIVRLSEEDFEILRVEAGIPSAGHELREDFTPLELNLHSAISNDKGCYTGQEVIARQINFDKITKRMVGLHLEGRVPTGASIYSADGKPVGEVTSLVRSPRHDIIALAVIKRPYFELGSEVEVRDGSTTIKGHVSGLPFGESD